MSAPPEFKKQMQLITNSSATCMKNCLRKYHYRYNLGLTRAETAQPLRTGTAIHLGLELWAKGAEPIEALREAIKDYETTPEWADAYDWRIESEIVGALLTGYFNYYGHTETLVEHLEVEKSFDIPLVNPETGYPSRTFRLAGKRDGLVRWNGRLSILEHKTTAQDIGADSKYWLRLRVDTQISLYVKAAREEGHDVVAVLYDVIRKPSIRPRQIPVLDSNRLKIVSDENGKRVYLKSGKPRQAAKKEEGWTLSTKPESPDEYGNRLSQDIAERPEFYFARREIPRLDDDLDRFSHEIWQLAQNLRQCQKNGHWYPNPGYNCDFCEFSDLCMQSVTVDADTIPSGFVRREGHSELK